MAWLITVRTSEDFMFTLIHFRYAKSKSFDVQRRESNGTSGSVVQGITMGKEAAPGRYVETFPFEAIPLPASIQSTFCWKIENAESNV